MITPHTTSKHHLRFYIVTATLIIGGILFLLSLNNSSSGFSLTSAIVGVTNQTQELIHIEPATDNKVNKILLEEAKESSKTVPIYLSFDQIPSVDKKAIVKNMNLGFNDVTKTTIKLNDDKLELNNLDNVDMDLEGFRGQVDFDADGLSLNGVATRIEVNKVAFSSEEDIKISFENLRYHTLEIDELELEDIDFPKGDGSLKVAEKLDYRITQESLDLFYFNGKLSIAKDDDEESLFRSIILDGVARSVAVSGDQLSLNLR
jgi:hypothetical protein